MKMNLKERPVLIPLAAAHVYQSTTEQKGKSEWEVQENETNEPLGTLPKNFSESEVFTVLHFARKYELLAFNIGMKHMSKELFAKWDQEKRNLIKVINELEIANTKLADKLSKLIGMEE